MRDAGNPADATPMTETDRPEAAVPRAENRPKVLALVGPTAVGKSAFAIELARKFGGEVINADSMQLYQGMDIGTAKPPPEARREIVHHLLDIWPVTKTASVAEYQRLARAAITSVTARGALPILVGGSGLYVRAALDRLEFPGTDPGIRARWEAELARVGPLALHRELARRDPQAAAGILPTNGRRIVRALEVLDLGRPRFTATMPGYESVYDVLLIGLDRQTSALDRRVEQRVAEMWAAGFVEEVRRLADTCGLRRGLTASRALGYRQVLEMLDGRHSEAQARELTVAATKRFVRRQRSWFRADPRVQWWDVADPEFVDRLARTIEVWTTSPS